VTHTGRTARRGPTRRSQLQPREKRQPLGIRPTPSVTFTDNACRSQLQHGRLVALWACVALLLLSACNESRRNLVSDPTTFAALDSGTRDAGLVLKPRDSGEEGGPAETFPAVDAATTYCGKRACSCADGADNDGDGLTDGLDPECTGAFDDDETSFATGQPSKQQACRDCYWDANNGSGDDGCRYPVECLSDPSFVGRGSCSSCEVTSNCQTSCEARTPNGCDCFGCCGVAKPSGELIHIQLVDTCTLANADDTTACPRCTPSASCDNPCGRCELCLGKTLADLPADCRTNSGPGYACDEGRDVCSSANPCPYGSYCHQGCCLVDLL